MKARLKILGVLLAVAVLMSGCGASSKYESAASAPMAMDMAAEETMAEEAIEMEAPAATVATNGEVAETPQVGRKLIRTFDINIETKEFDEILSGIQAKVQANYLLRPSSLVRISRNGRIRKATKLRRLQS